MYGISKGQCDYIAGDEGTIQNQAFADVVKLLQLH